MGKKKYSKFSPLLLSAATSPQAVCKREQNKKSTQESVSATDATGKQINLKFVILLRWFPAPLDAAPTLRGGHGIEAAQKAIC